MELLGPGGLLTGLTKTVLETALEAELTDHLGYDKHDPAGRNGENSRNGTRAKTVLTELGPVEIDVPRDRDGTFEPVIVRKRQRRLDSIDQIVLSLTARGLTTGEVSAHFDEVYGASVGKDTVSRITDKVLEEMAEWSSRPLDRVYPVVFLCAIVVKIRDGQVTNRPVYAAIGVTVNGERDILGLWAGDGGEGAKFWLSVLTELKNRGIADVCILVCDGLKGLRDAVGAVWPLTTVQTCIIHLLAQQLPVRRPAGLGEDRPRPEAGVHRPHRGRREGTLHRVHERLGRQVALWENAWTEFVPFLDYDVEIRKIICTTNAIESLNARYRRAVRARGHFPTEQAALKCLYLVTRSLDPTGRGRARWAIRWKPALNAFAITYAGRLEPSTTN